MPVWAPRALNYKTMKCGKWVATVVELEVHLNERRRKGYTNRVINPEGT